MIGGATVLPITLGTGEGSAGSLRSLRLRITDEMRSHTLCHARFEPALQ